MEINFEIPTADDIIAAAARIKPYISHTPVLTCDAVNERAEAEFFFKCENFQQTGSFKYRGACNNILSLSDEAKARGVCTHSSGNHAGALAKAAKLFNTKAHIVMPDNADKTKVAIVRNYGGEIHFCEPTLAARENLLTRIRRKTGATEIHPYNNLRTITGQATACMELLEQTNNDLDLIITPVGGGGLLSGTALAAHYFGKKTRVVAGEPEGANDAARSFYGRKLIPMEAPQTMADGLRTSLGSFTFPIISKYVHEIFTVTEASIAEAMHLLFDKMKIVVEPSSAVAVAAILENCSKFAGKKVGVILTGGNISHLRMHRICQTLEQTEHDSRPHPKGWER